MPIEFRCTQCNRLLRTQDDTAGKQAKCPECGTILAIPAGGASPPGAAPQSPFGQVEPPDGASATPFGPGEAENPYASPRGFEAVSPGAMAYTHPAVHAYATARVTAPAMALIVTGSLGLALQLLATLVNILGLTMQPNRQAPEFFMLSGGMSIFFGILGVVPAIVVIVGAWKMKNLESYGFAMTGAIIAMVPCTSPCCLLGLPFGIWALVVLSDPQVRAAFATPWPR